MARFLPLLLDLVAVLVFAVVGRASHAEELTVAGIAQTAWPFLAAAVVATGIYSLIAAEGAGFKAGLVVWLVTLLGGMALRLVTGTTAAVAFILVAAGILAAAFFGWRLVGWLLGRRSDRAVKTQESVAEASD